MCKGFSIQPEILPKAYKLHGKSPTKTRVFIDTLTGSFELRRSDYDGGNYVKVRHLLISVPDSLIALKVPVQPDWNSSMTLYH